MSFFYFANQSDSWIFESKYNATPLKEVSNTSKDSISTKMTRMPTTPFDSLDPSGVVMLHFASAMKVWRKVSFFFHLSRLKEPQCQKVKGTNFLFYSFGSIKTVVWRDIDWLEQLGNKFKQLELLTNDSRLLTTFWSTISQPSTGHVLYRNYFYTTKKIQMFYIFITPNAKNIEQMF